MHVKPVVDAEAYYNAMVNCPDRDQEQAAEASCTDSPRTARRGRFDSLAESSNWLVWRF